MVELHGSVGHHGFEDYVISTNDPGPWMLIVVLLYLLLSTLILPCFVFLGRKMKKRKMYEKDSEEETEAGCKELDVTTGTISCDIDRRCEEAHIDNAVNDTFEARTDQTEFRSSEEHSDERNLKMRQHSYILTETNANDDPPIIVNDDKEEEKDRTLNNNKSISFEDDGCDESVFSIGDVSAFNPEKENKAGTMKRTRRRGLRLRRVCGSACRSTRAISALDRESIRILQLGGTFTAAAIVDSIFGAIIVALISKYLGVEALSACVVASLLLGLSDTCTGGIANALTTVCSHAIGAKNYNLAGQYLQIAMVVYFFLSVLVMGIWWFFMEDCILSFGMSEYVAKIGADYAKVAMFDYLIAGQFESFAVILDVSGYAVPATIFDVVANAIDCAVVWILLATVEGMDLFWMGVAHLVSSTFFFTIFFMIGYCKGWLDPFWPGLTKTNALKNTSAVKYVINTAIPITMGDLLEYGEWQAFTIFAASLGPAEVATWGILETIWELFESAVEAFAEAGSMRLAFHLGRGKVQKAKRSAGKTIFWSICVSILVSSIFLICMPYIPYWFTNDSTLQSLTKDCLPMIGIGNIYMSFASIAWALVGAQNRYALGTSICAVVTFVLTVPLAAIFTYGFRFSLPALVGSMLIGYTTSGSALSYVLLTSDWEAISRSIVEENEREECDSDDDDDDHDHDSISDEIDGTFELKDSKLGNKSDHGSTSSTDESVEIEIV